MEKSELSGAVGVEFASSLWPRWGVCPELLFCLSAACIRCWGRLSLGIAERPLPLERQMCCPVLEDCLHHLILGPCFLLPQDRAQLVERFLSCNLLMPPPGPGRFGPPGVFRCTGSSVPSSYLTCPVVACSSPKSMSTDLLTCGEFDP